MEILNSKESNTVKKPINHIRLFTLFIFYIVTPGIAKALIKSKHTEDHVKNSHFFLIFSYIFLFL